MKIFSYIRTLTPPPTHSYIIMWKLYLWFIWFCVISMKLSTASRVTTRAKKSSNKALFFAAASQAKAVANFASFDVNDSRLTFSFCEGAFQACPGGRRRNTIFSVAKSFCACRKVKPNKSIFNYLLLREINSTTRRQKTKTSVSKQKSATKENEWEKRAAVILHNIK